MNLSLEMVFTSHVSRVTLKTEGQAVQKTAFQIRAQINATQSSSSGPF